MNNERKNQLMKLLGVDLSDLDVAQENIDDAENFALEDAVPEESNELYQADPGVTDQLRKLLGGAEDLNLDEVEVEPETIDDPQAPLELRKSAIEKVRQKYLGR